MSPRNDHPAERMASHYAEDKGSEKSPYWKKSFLFSEDRDALVEWAVDRLAADASEPITAERLEAMGGHRHPNAELREWAFEIASPKERTFVDVFVDPEDSLWYAGLRNSRRSFIVPTPLRTMGDVRKLLIGLGAKLP